MYAFLGKFLANNNPPEIFNVFTLHFAKLRQTNIHVSFLLVPTSLMTSSTVRSNQHIGIQIQLLTALGHVEGGRRKYHVNTFN